MKNKPFLLLLAILSIAGCARNAITGRNQLSLVSEDTLQKMANVQYAQFLAQNKVVDASGSVDAGMVTRVGTRIANAINEYYKQKGLSSALQGYKWEFNLVQSNEVNAWCMPVAKLLYTPAC